MAFTILLCVYLRKLIISVRHEPFGFAQGRLVEWLFVQRINFASASVLGSTGLS
jgi:hypothetical protein